MQNIFKDKNPVPYFFSGPAQVVLGSSSTASTSASFSLDGTYTLRLTVSDGEKNRGRSNNTEYFQG